MSVDLTGIDAFDNIVERLVTATLESERARERTDAASTEAAQLKIALAETKRQLATYALRQGRDEKLHGVLKDVLAYLRQDGMAPAPEPLIAGLSQAIADTDPIPF